jgi:hypothetical protein
MTNPQYTVAAEVAQLFAMGLFPLTHARQRLKDLGIDPETAETMLANAADPSTNLSQAGRQHLEALTRACRTLILAWEKGDPDPQKTLDILEPCINQIHHLIGEPKE